MKGQGKTPARKVLDAAVVMLIFTVALPLVLVTIGFGLLYRGALYLLVWLLWLPRGKDILFVYSDSPTWREYMTKEILPLVERRAVVLNWSERSKWSVWSLGVLVFHRFGGTRDFNPLVVLFRPFRRATTFRFWPAFKDWKQGHREPVERLRQGLGSAL